MPTPGRLKDVEGVDLGLSAEEIVSAMRGEWATIGSNIRFDLLSVVTGIFWSVGSLVTRARPAPFPISEFSVPNRRGPQCAKVPGPAKDREGSATLVPGVGSAL